MVAAKEAVMVVVVRVAATVAVATAAARVEVAREAEEKAVELKTVRAGTAATQGFRNCSRSSRSRKAAPLYCSRNLLGRSSRRS